MENVKKHLSLLGLPVQDKVTKIKGVVDSICFDLYGCIQVSINPGLKTDGNFAENRWYDVSRIKILSKAKKPKPVMDPPNFDFGVVAEGGHGPATKALRT